jgi:hypothetical protein
VGGRHRPLVRVAKVDYSLRRCLNVRYYLKVGLELSAVLLEQGKLTLWVGRHGRQPGPRLDWDYWCRRSAVSSVQTRRRHPQGFADPTQDIFPFARTHRVLQ